MVFVIIRYWNISYHLKVHWYLHIWIVPNTFLLGFGLRDHENLNRWPISYKFHVGLCILRLFCKVNLGAVHRIVGIVTQGNSDGADWVTQYTLSYSDDDVNFIDYPPESATPRVCWYIVLFQSNRYKCTVYKMFTNDLRIKFQLSLITVSIVSDQLNRLVTWIWHFLTPMHVCISDFWRQRGRKFIRGSCHWSVHVWYIYQS